jgi:hypothetical protein
MYSSQNVFRCGNKTQILPLLDTEVWHFILNAVYTVFLFSVHILDYFLLEAGMVVRIVIRLYAGRPTKRGSIVSWSKNCFCSYNRPNRL